VTVVFSVLRVSVTTVRNRKKIAEAINQLPVVLNGGYQGVIGRRKKLGYDGGKEKERNGSEPVEVHNSFLDKFVK
jgi:hypothetical protein